MQHFVGRPGLRPVRAAAVIVLAAFLPAAPLAAAEPGASDWVDGNLSQVRLIAGLFDGKHWSAGVQIRLKGKAHTYWRNPGDGGVPPEFDFSRSVNLKDAKAAFPAPTRSGASGEEVIGYEKNVVFPLHITPLSADKPVDLNLTFRYAACEKICVPELAKLRLTLAKGQDNPATASIIARYQAALPRPLTAKDAPALAISAKDPGKRWIARVDDKAAPAADLFVEAPDGWYFSARAASGGGFEIVLLQKPEEPAARPPLHVTLTTAGGAFEGKLNLP